MKLFELGRVVITPAALDFCERHQGVDIPKLLDRHQTGDWGDLDYDDKKANDTAIQKHTRVFSSYKFDDEGIWIITEADRSSTCILLPEDY